MFYFLLGLKSRLNSPGIKVYMKGIPSWVVAKGLRGPS